MNKTSAQRKQPGSEGNTTLTAFAAALGSTKGLDPIPPDQYLTYQDKRYPLKLRLWAWELSHTVSRNARSPHAVNAKGKALSLKHAAADLEEDLANVHRAWRQLENEGRVRRTRDGRLILVADFDLKNDGEDEAKEIVCTSFKIGYIQRDLAKLAPELRQEFLRLEKEDDDLFRFAHRAEIAALRFKFDQRQNSRYAAFGLELRRQEHGKPEERKRRAEWLQAVLPFVENLVLTIESQGLHKPPLKPALTIPPIISSEVLSELASAPHPSPTETPHKELCGHLAAIAKAQRPMLGKPNAQTLANFWNLFQKKKPDGTVQELADSVVSLVKENSGITTWGGVFTEFRDSGEAAPPIVQPTPQRIRYEETREEKIMHLETALETALAIANDKSGKYPPAERTHQRERLQAFRAELAALNNGAGAAGGA